MKNAPSDSVRDSFLRFLRLFSQLVRWSAMFWPAAIALAQTATLTTPATSYSSAGGEVTFTLTITYTGQTLSALGASITLPSGWSYKSASGANVPDIRPAASATVTAEFAYTTIPADSAAFSFVLNYPAGLVGNQTFPAVVPYRANSTPHEITLPSLVLAPPAGALPTITSATTAIATVGAAFTYTATASPAATTFNITGLPAGLTANAATGVISGTPSAAGTASINLSATSGNGTGPVTVLTLTIGNRPVISSATVASGTVGTAFSYGIIASNTPTSYAATGLPAGLTFNPETGVISGLPAAAGVFTVSLTASNAFGTGTATSLALTVAAAPVPVITSDRTANATVGVPFSFTVQTTPAATSFAASGLPAGVTIDAATGIITGTFSTTALLTVTITATNASGHAEQTLTIRVNSRPAFATQPQSARVAIGGSVVLSATATGSPPPTYQWQKDGTAIAGATGSSLTLGNFQVGDAGSYTLVLTNTAGSTTSQAAVIGVESTAKVVGQGNVVGNNIVHTNGNVYDQVLLTGAAATITADSAQVTRVSFIDLNDDIVQVEFSGAGTLTLTLENASGPAAPIKYNQPGVTYMKGHASLVITGANATSNVSIFTVGTLTAVNQALFKAGESYDGIADIGLLSIATTDGKFGGIRTANAGCFRASGLTGLYAPGVAVQGPVFVHDITADADATSVLVFASAAEVRITGGNLLQLNHRAIQVDGLIPITFAAGVTSGNIALPAQTNRARFERNGVDVTDQLLPPDH